MRSRCGTTCQRPRGQLTRFLVSAGHIHNYERSVVDGVTYLVSGGGGAPAYFVERTEGTFVAVLKNVALTGDAAGLAARATS